jgi:hypothetical protein
VIVYERTGDWARALRRAWGDGTAPIRETRSLPECRQAAGEYRAALVALELPSTHVDAVLNLLLEIERDYPAHRAIVVASRSLAQYEWLAREAGAVAFATSPRLAGPLAAVARRFVKSHAAEEIELTQRIWASLPWAEQSRHKPET